MSTTEQNAVKAWSWYEAVKDGKHERYNLECNKQAVFDYITEVQFDTITPETVKASFEAASGNGNRLPNGFSLAVKTDTRLAAEQSAKRAADEAAAAEKARLDAIAEANRHFELVELVLKHRGISDPNGLRVQRDLISRWTLERLEQEAAAIRLRQESRGQTGREFSKAQGLDKIDAKGREVNKRPGTIVLPADLTARKIKQMSGQALRMFIKQWVVKGHDERHVLAAINQRIAETASSLEG